MAFKMNGWSPFTKEIDPVTGKEREGGKEYSMHKEKKDLGKPVQQDPSEPIPDDEYTPQSKGTYDEYRPQSTYSGEGKRPEPGDHNYIPDTI